MPSAATRVRKGFWGDKGQGPARYLAYRFLHRRPHLTARTVPPPPYRPHRRYNANRAALVQSRLKALERLAEVEVMEEDPEYIFRWAVFAGFLCQFLAVYSTFLRVLQFPAVCLYLICLVFCAFGRLRRCAFHVPWIKWDIEQQI